MTLRALAQVEEAPPALHVAEAPLEWLVTNGLSGYASGTMAGPPPRRFHGLLIAAHPAPLGRIMLLLTRRSGGRRAGQRPVCLGRGRVRLKTSSRRRSISRAGCRDWQFTLTPDACDRAGRRDAARTQHRAPPLSPRGGAGVRPPARTAVARFPCARGHAGRRRRRMSIVQTRSRRRVRVHPGRPVGRAQDARCPVRPRRSRPTRRTARTSSIQSKQARGYDHSGSMHAPGVFELDSRAGRTRTSSATSEPWVDSRRSTPVEACDRDGPARTARRLESPGPADGRDVPAAAGRRPIRGAAGDARRRERAGHAAGDEPRTVIAGYHWFTDWGRDTMISLEGLTLVDRPARRGARHPAHVRACTSARPDSEHVPRGEQRGPVPHRRRHAVVLPRAAIATTRSPATARSSTSCCRPARASSSAPCEGTLFNIRVDQRRPADAGRADLQLTWMDAKVGDWVVTPRRGKAVEINALWHNALVLLQRGSARTAARPAGRRSWPREARRAARPSTRDSGTRQAGHLFDVVDGRQGDDDACRPNQVIAIAVHASLLDRSAGNPCSSRSQRSC